LVAAEVELFEGVVVVQAELGEFVLVEIELNEAAVSPQVKFSEPFAAEVDFCFCG
jgi:hypothetical protein